jgi:hypothetical protein
MAKDERYTITKEFCGYSQKMYVLRFCGDFLGSFEKKYNAVSAAKEHVENGYIDNRKPYYQYRNNFFCS